jgi:hypothetical protein
MFISFAVDRIHLILYLTFVISSLCFSDLPVSRQITAFAISGMMMILLWVILPFVFCARFFGEIEKQWLAWLSDAAIISSDKLYCCVALRLTMACGVCGVTARIEVIFKRRCEFGTVSELFLCWGDILCAVVFGTLGGETRGGTLGGALSSFFLAGRYIILCFMLSCAFENYG